MYHLNLKTQLKKNSGPPKFDFIPLHLTFQGDVSKTKNKNCTKASFQGRTLHGPKEKQSPPPMRHFGNQLSIFWRIWAEKLICFQQCNFC